MQNNPISGVTPIDKILRTCDVKIKKKQTIYHLYMECVKNNPIVKNMYSVKMLISQYKYKKKCIHIHVE